MDSLILSKCLCWQKRLRNLLKSSALHTEAVGLAWAFGECTSIALLVMTGSMLPVACGPLHCLFGECCSAVKCLPSWQRRRAPLAPTAGFFLDHTSQADWHSGGCGGKTRRREGVTEGWEQLAVHLGARSGLLPALEKISLLTP